ncbi:hypothetical protein LINPERPRIM_LOCUS31476 [Linum perenne]
MSQGEISDGARQSDDFTAVDESRAADTLTFPLPVSTLLPSTGFQSSSQTKSFFILLGIVKYGSGMA